MVRRDLRLGSAAIVAAALLGVVTLLVRTGSAALDDACPPAATPSASATATAPSPTTASPGPSSSSDPSPTADPSTTADPTASSDPSPTADPSTTADPTASPDPTADPTSSTSGGPTPIPVGTYTSITPPDTSGLNAFLSQSPTPTESTSGARAGTAASPGPCADAALTIDAAPRTGVYGTVFRVFGRLTCGSEPVRDEPIIVSRTTPADATFDSVRTTDADGRYVTHSRPAASTSFASMWDGGVSCARGASSAPASIHVRPGVIVNPSAQRVRRGATVSFSGRVLPEHPGRFVQLQVLQGSTGRWADAGWQRLDASSSYRFRYRKTDGAGWLLIRVAFPTQDDDHVWNVSRHVRVDWT